MPLIEPHTRRKQLAKHRTRLDCGKNEMRDADAGCCVLPFKAPRHDA